MSELNDFLNLIAEAKKTDPVAKKAKQIENQVKESVKSDLICLFDQLAFISKKVELLPEETQGKAEAQQIIAEVLVEPIKEEPKQEQQGVEKYLTDKSFQQPNPDVVQPDVKAIQQKIKFLEQWLGKISAHGPGSGEVNFRYLDDVNRGTMTPSNDNWVLEYDAATKKAQFTKNVGPIESLAFDITHVDEGHDPGTLCWNESDRTLNLSHPGGPRQQIGQEQYMLVRNSTGSTIDDGTIVGFSGAADSNGEARILTAPYLADGTQPSLYIIGVATQTIEDGSEGFITTFGKVRELNTTGTPVGETWQVGDILYANPTYVGKLTNVKPTAPNNVIPVAAALKIGETDGEIFVRPTIEQMQIYGKFSRTTDLTAAVADTAYTIQLDSTQISNGVTIGSPTSRIVASQSGLFQIDASIQITSGNSSQKTIRVWIRKNGIDVPYSTRIVSNDLNGAYAIVKLNQSVSLNANEYVELAYAVSDTGLSLNATPATAYSPSAPAVYLSVTQVQL